MEANVETDDPVMAKLNITPLGISMGDMRLLRETVIMKWKDINRSYQGPLLGDTLLHRVCREGCEWTKKCIWDEVCSPIHLLQYVTFGELLGLLAHCEVV